MRSDILNSNSDLYNTKKIAIDYINNVAATTRTLLAEESGTIFLVDMSAVDNNVTITLPTASSSAGCYYEFIYTANCDDDADFAVTTGDDDVDIYGYVVRGGANSTVLDVDGLSKVTVDGSASQATEGLRLTFLCDGTNWHLRGTCSVVVGTALITESATA